MENDMAAHVSCVIILTIQKEKEERTHRYQSVVNHIHAPNQIVNQKSLMMETYAVTLFIHSLSVYDRNKNQERIKKLKSLLFTAEDFPKKKETAKEQPTNERTVEVCSSMFDNVCLWLRVD